MRLLDRYIARTVLFAMFIVLGVMLGMELILALADELGETGSGYTAWHALQYVALRLPGSLYELLPYAALGGALIGLGLLTSHNELIIMRSAGVATGAIVWAVMKPILLIMIASLAIGEWIAPPLEQKAESERALAVSGGDAVNTWYGDWRRVGNAFIHVNAIAPGGREFHGLSRYRIDDSEQRLISASFAERGRYVEEGGESYWLLSEVRETRFREGRTEVRRQETQRWRVGLSPQLLTTLLVDSDRQSISGLYRFARFFESQGLESDDYFLDFWKKLLQPLSTASLVLLAVAFVFGPLRDATMGYRVFMAIMIGLGFMIVQRLVGPLTLLYGIPPVVAVLAPMALIALLGIFLLRRV